MATSSFSIVDTPDKMDCKSDDEYVPDSFKNIFAEADANLEKILSSEELQVSIVDLGMGQQLDQKLQLQGTNDKIHNDDNQDTVPAGLLSETQDCDSGETTPDSSILVDMDIETPSMNISINTTSTNSNSNHRNTSRMSMSMQKHTPMPFQSPASDIDGPYDLELGSACRPNPADLYTTSYEARMQAMDDQPGVCPDHEDDCKCHLQFNFFPLNLKERLDGVEILEGLEGVEAQAMERTPRNDDSSFASEAEIKEELEVELEQELETNDDDFLPESESPIVAGQLSNDTDLSFGPSDDDDSDNEEHDNDNSNILLHSSEEEDIEEFLPNNHRSSIMSGTRMSMDVASKRKSGAFAKAKEKHSAAPAQLAVAAESAVAVESAKSKPISRKGKKDKPQDDTKRKFRQRRSKGTPQDVIPPAPASPSKARKFNISLPFPRSPRMNSKRARQYTLLDKIDNNRIDVPLKIEWSERREERTKTLGPKEHSRASIASTSTTTTSTATTVKSPGKTSWRSRKLTVPKAPNLLTRNKRGEKKYSTAGGKQDEIATSLLENNINNDKKKKKKKNKKHTATVPKEPRLLSKEKMGEIKYSSTGSKVVKTLEVVTAKPMQKTLGKRPMNQKFGEKRYSTAGVQKEQSVSPEKPQTDWAKRKPTVPKAPMISFFIQEPTKRDARKEVQKEQPSEPFVFKARPAPNFSNPSIHKSKVLARPLTIPRPFRLATTERAISSPRDPSPMPLRVEKTWAQEKVEASPPMAFRARSVPNFTQSSIPQRKVSSRPLTVPKPFHLSTEDRANSPRNAKASAPVVDRVVNDNIGKDTAMENKMKSFVFKARPVPNFSKADMPQQRNSSRRVTVPKPFHLTLADRASSQRSIKECSPTHRNDLAADNSNAVEERFVFRARSMPSFSRNPNGHRKALAKRALTVPVPFRLVSDDRANSPRRQLRQTTASAGETIRAQFPSPSKKAPTSQKPFRFLTQERAIVRKSPSSRIQDDSEFDLLPPPETKRVHIIGALNVNGSQVERLAKKRLTVPKPFRLTPSNRKGSEGSKLKEKEVFSFRARPMPSYKPSIQQPTVTKRLTSPRPFRLRTEERANIDDHGELKTKLFLRSKQSAVARAEQFDETLNTVDRLLEMSSSLLSTDSTNPNMCPTGALSCDDGCMSFETFD